MKINGKMVLSGLIVIACGTLSTPTSGRFATTAAPGSTAGLRAANPFEKYRDWLRVNQRPMKMGAGVSALCAAPTTGRQPNEGPHQDRFIVVYVNGAASKSMMEEPRPNFPPGSMIVKEKLSAPESVAPELLTAMVKRERGFNPAANDWEFFVLSGDAKIVQAQGKLETCLACHSAQRGDDFVFRNYRPGKISPPPSKGF